MITVTTLMKTCDSCPAQWEGRTDTNDDVYIRYRYGYLSVRVNGIEIFGENIGDGLDGSMDFQKLRRITRGHVWFSL